MPDRSTACVRVYADAEGESMRFGSGSAVLLEDAAGRGHFTRIASEEFGLCAMVHLRERA